MTAKEYREYQRAKKRQRERILKEMIDQTNLLLGLNIMVAFLTISLPALLIWLHH